MFVSFPFANRLRCLKSFKSRPPSPQRRPRQYERLEERRVMATMAFLDFDGDFISSAQMAQGGWAEQGAVNIPAFTGLFTSDRPELDMNGDGLVNASDAKLAVSRIVEKVTVDFAPYDISIVLGDQDSFHSRLTDFDRGDSIIMISGGRDFIPSESAWGWAPLDIGNNRDEYAFVFTEGMIDDEGFTGSQLINSVAHTVSHEIGHTLGLKHALPSPSDDVGSHHMMAVPVNTKIGMVDVRDYAHDFNFPDAWFSVAGGGSQNAHQYLLQTLGPSNDAWAAVLKPGVLTIQGSDNANEITVSQGYSSALYVTIDGTQTVLNWYNPGLNSLNPYDEPISFIRVEGRGGNDTISVLSSVNRVVQLYGGDGHDTLQGGSASDTLDGGPGNDTLLGGAGHDKLHGGSGDDELYGGSENDDLWGDDGSDELFGEGGHDELFGGHGVDWLQGGAGDDELDGGDDAWNARDYLYGGTGDDTFVQHAAWYWWVYDEDFIGDRQSGESIRNV